MEQHLEEIGERITRLVSAPDEVGGAWLRLASPVMRALRWQPEVSVERSQALLESLGAGAASEDELQAAVDELSHNVGELERACVVHGEMPTAYAGWLWRLYGVLSRARELHAHATSLDAASFAEAGAVRVLPPLVSPAPGDAPPVRVGHVDVLLDAALQETELLGRRRRLLETARELLLDTATTMTVDPDQAVARHDFITQQIARINRFEAAGVQPEVGLGYQLKEASRRDEGDRAHAVLSALSEIAAQRGDRALEGHARRALTRVQGGKRGATQAIDSLQRSADELLGARVVETVHESLERAREAHAKREPARDAPMIERMEWDQHKAYIADGAESALLNASLSVDGAFELGGVMSPHRVREELRLRRLVHFPAQELLVERARRVEDVPGAIIEDPRTILYDLAAGRLLARRYAVEERVVRERPRFVSEVRIYVLDGSGSMLGPRARMRDAIMVCELSTLLQRLMEPDREVETVLYYRYFNEELGETTRVDSPDGAMEAIGDVLTGERFGGTNIEHALLTSFEQIAQAREDDLDLARAQIVLVTDGEAPVDLKKVAAARNAVRGLPVGVSIVALGQENEALRQMAALQRMSGERVFYHFVPDATLKRIVSGQAHGRLPIHLPQGASIEVLGPELRQIADEIEGHLHARDAEAMERVDDWEHGLREVGLDPQRHLCEGERARVEALRRDRRALQTRFDRWFPPAPPDGNPRPTTDAGPTTRRAADDWEELEEVHALLHGVASVVDMVASSDLRRQADALEILERLLLDAGIGPWRYLELLERYPAELAGDVAMVRALAPPA